MRVKTPRISPTQQPLNPRFDKMIAAYATAASAVGVALLAAAQPAEGKIVYTNTRVTITIATRTYALDLNHDGIPDFNIGFCSCIPHGNGIVVSSSRGVGNGALEQPGSPYSAAALMSGAPIGPKQVFKPAYSDVGMAFVGSYGSPYSVGPWIGVVGRYVGLKFMIHGQVHYGWARMTITKQLTHVILTGYAYETIANRPLKAGQTSETAQAEARTAATFGRPADGPSLGMLALGAEGMDVWRREEEVVSE